MWNSITPNKNNLQIPVCTSSRKRKHIPLFHIRCIHCGTRIRSSRTESEVLISGLQNTGVAGKCSWGRFLSEVALQQENSGTNQNHSERVSMRSSFCSLRWDKGRTHAVPRPEPRPCMSLHVRHFQQNNCRSVLYSDTIISVAEDAFRPLPDKIFSFLYWPGFPRINEDVLH